MMEHTLFSLPFAVCAFLLESAGTPPVGKVVWILVAVFGARNAANALNRLIDHAIDAANPRTAERDLPVGRVTRIDLWLFTALCGLLFIVAAWRLNTLCLLLVPVAGVLVFLYSFTKRFTWLSHYWLGITCSAATMGSFLALTGRFELRYFPLTAAVALWVAGFDIIYALQDIDHDRRKGLHSAPARFGGLGALILAGLSHAGTLLFLVVSGFFYAGGFLYFTGVGCAGALLVAQHVVAWKGPMSRIPFAAYRLNQILAPVVMVFTVADIYLHGALYG